MAATMDNALNRLGLSGHQAIYVVHRDTPHGHIHAFLNLVNPDDGRTAKLAFSKEKLSQWAEEYEGVHGVHCEQRILNNAKRSRENKRQEFNRASGHANQDKAKFPRYKEQNSARDELLRRYRTSDAAGRSRPLSGNSVSRLRKACASSS